MIIDSLTRFVTKHSQRPLTEKDPRRDEKTFFHFWFKQSLVYLRPTLLATIVLVLSFYPIDSIVLEADAAEDLQSARLFIMTPLLAFFYLLSFTSIHPLIYFFGLSLIYLVGGTLFTFGISALNGASLYGLIAMTHALVFLFIPSRIPAIFCIPIGILLTGSDIGAIYDVNAGTAGERLMYSAGIITLTLVLSISVINRDLNAFKNYHLLKRASQFTFDQGVWAAMIARVLKHELGNHLTGITSSIEMIQLIDNRDKDNPILSNALQRNLATVSALRELLNRVSAYANIELMALHARSYRFQLSETLNNAMVAFDRRHPSIGNPITTQAGQNDIQVKGDNIILTVVIASLLEHSYSKLDKTKSQRASVRITQDGGLVAITAHAAAAKINRQRKNESTHNAASTETETETETPNFRTDCDNSEKTLAAQTEALEGDGEQFVLTVARQVLGLYSARIDKITQTSTSYELFIVF